MPIWPAIWQGTATFVPTRRGQDLVSVVVVSPGWQPAVLIPRRVDLEWVLRYLRRLTPGPLMSIRAPLAVHDLGLSNAPALDWRHGDMLLAFQHHGESEAYSAPTYISAVQVRYSAVWSYDFVVQCKLPLVLWRPGIWPSRTEMPGPAQ